MYLYKYIYIYLFQVTKMYIEKNDFLLYKFYIYISGHKMYMEENISLYINYIYFRSQKYIERKTISFYTHFIYINISSHKNVYRGKLFPSMYIIYIYIFQVTKMYIEQNYFLLYTLHAFQVTKMYIEENDFPLYIFLWPEDGPQWPKHVVVSIIIRIQDSCVLTYRTPSLIA